MTTELETLVMREELINRAKKQRAEILQLFSDAEHWNNTHTVFERVDPDPDGQLKRILSGLNQCLEREGA